MNRIFAESPDAVFRKIAARRNHPCAHVTKDKSGLVTVTFVHRLRRGACCSRCNEIMPLTFWQHQPGIENQVPA